MTKNGRAIGLTIGILATILVLSATLFPVIGQTDDRFQACIFCGDRVWADFLLNVLLFGPFGLGLRTAGMTTRRAVFAALLFSGFVEVAQIAIPGRFPSYSDLGANTLGALAGVLTPNFLAWCRRVEGNLAGAAATFGAAAFLFGIWATGAMLRPAFPSDSTYYGQWTADFGHMEWYRARIHRVTLNETLHLRSWYLERSVLVRRLLLEGADLRVQATAGPQVPALGPLFGVMDGNRVEIVLVGVDRTDLVTRYRMVAADLGFDQPDLRLPGALEGIDEGDPLDVSVRGPPPDRCIRVNDVERCGLGHSAGIGWSFLMYLEHLTGWQKGILSSAWLFSLAFPVAFFAARWGGWWGGAAVLVPLIALVTAPRLGLQPTPWDEWLGALFGLAAGWRISKTLRFRPWSNVEKT